FSMRLSLGYPDAVHEKTMLSSGSTEDVATEQKPPLAAWQQEVAAIHCSEDLIDYLHRLIVATRNEPGIRLGLSPRGGLQWLAVARAWAFIHGRDHVLPDDIQDVALSVVGHKCVSTSNDNQSIDQTLVRIIESVDIYS
ncbi:MAG: MoxR family ATPase, partial [Halieaceae bacterium]